MTQPPALKPHPYQADFVEYGFPRARMNHWAHMGTGKTISTLMLINAWFADGVKGPALILGPPRVARTVWTREAEKWADFSGLRVQSLLGTPLERTSNLIGSWGDANIYTLSYELLPWLAENKKVFKQFKIVVADESTKLRGFRVRQGTQRTKVLREFAHSSVTHWLNLSGSPMPLGYQDLWGPQWFVDRGATLGADYTSFMQRWFSFGFDGFEIIPTQAARREIPELIGPSTFSVDPKDYFDLKDPVVRKVYVELPSRARQWYDEMEKDFFTQIEDHEIEALAGGAKGIKCLQLANGAIYVDELRDKYVETHDEKIQALESILEEAGGAPVIVLYHFKHDLARLRRAFKQGVVFDANPKTEDRFNKGKIPLLFLHPASAAHGTNLQHGGNIIAVFGLWWDFELYSQAIERIGPMRQLQAGFDRNVFIYLIMARDTLDESVFDRLHNKASTQRAVVDYMARRKKK